MSEELYFVQEIFFGKSPEIWKLESPQNEKT